MIDEQFRRWSMPSVSMPSAPHGLHDAITETEDLPEMIEIVREAELACMRRLQELNRQTRSTRQPTDTEQSTPTIELLVTNRELMECDTRIKWLQQVHRHLQNKRQRSETASTPPSLELLELLG